MRRGRDDLWLKSFIPLIFFGLQYYTLEQNNTNNNRKSIVIFSLFAPCCIVYCKINWNFCGDHNIQTKCEKGTAAAATLDTLEWSH